MKRNNLKMLAAVAAACCTTRAFAGAGTNGTWSLTGTSGGVWSNSANWQGGLIADGQDGIATFGTPSVANTVSLDSVRNIGELNFNNSSTTLGWTLTNTSGSSLNLTTSIGLPSINVVGATAVVNATLTGTQGLVKTGTGQLTLGGTNSYTGGTNISAGTLSISSSGNVGGTSAVIDLAGGNLAANVTLANPINVISNSTVTSGGTGLIFTGPLTGTGTITTSGVTQFAGNATGFTGTISGTGQINFGVAGANANCTSGTIAYTTSAVTTNSFILACQGTYTANMGSIAGSAGTEIRAGNSGTLGLVTVSTGQLNTSTTFAGTIANNSSTTTSSSTSSNNVLALTKVGTGTLTLSNATNYYAGPTNISGGAIAAAALANGGSTSSIGASSNAASNLIFSGGTLIYTGATTNTDRSFTISPGVQADFNVSSAAATLNMSGLAVTTTGGLTKDGAGTLALTGAHTYSGPTLVNAGTLLVNSPGSLTNTSAITLGSTAVFGGTGTINSLYNQAQGTLAPGGVGTVGTFTFTNGVNLSGGTLALDVTSSGSDLLNVNGGTLKLLAPTVLNIPALATAGTGPFEIIDYTGALGGSLGNLIAASRAASLYTAASTINPSENAIYLNVSSGVVSANLNWNSSSSGSFDLVTSKNWLNTGTNAQDYYYQGDAVNFLDGAGLQPNITITGALSPAAVVVNANSINYNFSGTGSLTGTTGLTVSGTSMLTIGTNNTFTGSASINAGTTLVTGTTALGTGALTISSGATVQVGNGTTVGTLGNSSISDNGALIFNHSDTVTPGEIDGSGLVSVVGSGNVVLAAADTYGGGTNISTGTVSLLGNNALGSGPVTITSGGTLGLGYAPGNFVLANTFNLSGAVIHTGYNSPSSLTGSVSLGAPLTVNMDGGSSLLFTGSLTTGNYSITSNGNSASSLTIGSSSTNLGTTSFIGNGPTLIFQPPTGNVYTVAGTISGVSALNMYGPGNAILAASNSYSGGTNIYTGILIAGANGSLGAITSTVNIIGGGSTGALGLQGGVSISNPITLNGRQGVATNLPIIENLSGNNFINGPLSMTTSGAYYSIQSDAGLLRINGAITQVAGAGNRFYQLQGAGNGLITSPIINGTAVVNVVMNGTGTWTIAGSSGYTGVTQANTGTLAFAPNYSSGVQTITLSGGVNISSGALVQINAAATHANHSLLVTSSLSLAGNTGAWTGKLDLANNDLDVQNGSLSNVTSQVGQGFGNGAWNNNSGGIVSTAAASDNTRLTALGVIQNNQNGTAIYGASNPFDGTSPGASDVLVKYTYYGDANLDGIVDGSDYSLIDSGYLTQATGWLNGDFNYDGVINGSDYTLIDNAFNSQGASLAATVAPTAELAGTSVPEPATLGLVSMAAFGLLGRRRRCRK